MLISPRICAGNRVFYTRPASGPGAVLTGTLDVLMRFSEVVLDKARRAKSPRAGLDPIVIVLDNINSASDVRVQTCCH